jgi:chromosome segregation ATPase
MDPQVRAEFDEMREAHRRAMERMDAAEKRMDAAMERMDRADERMDRHDRKMEALDAAWRKRMDKADQRAELAEKRMELADQRGDKFDLKLEATRKLVEAGIKIVSRLAADTRELKRSQKAFLDSFRSAGNGRRHAG